MFTVNTVYLLYKLAESHIIPATNEQTPGCTTSRKHTRISIFKIPRSKSGIAEHKIEKKNIRRPIFLFRDTTFYITSMQSNTRVVSIVAVFFNSCCYFNSYIWSKDIALTVKKSYTLWYNCKLEAINQSSKENEKIRNGI